MTDYKVKPTEHPKTTEIRIKVSKEDIEDIKKAALVMNNKQSHLKYKPTNIAYWGLMDMVDRILTLPATVHVSIPRKKLIFDLVKTRRKKEVKKQDDK